MTPKEKEAMLATMEKLMNGITLDYQVSGLPKHLISYHLGKDYPEIDWHWEGDRIKVTGFTQKEL